jgi:hypothetical protein
MLQDRLTGPAVSLLLIVLFTLSGCTPSAATVPPTTPALPTVLPTHPVLTSTTPVQPTLPPAPKFAIDACALLTKTDAAAILGKPVKDPEIPIQASANYDVTSCEYHAQTGTAMDNVTLILTEPISRDALSAKTAFTSDESTVQSSFGAAPLDVPNLGDAAYWVAGSGNELFVLQGDVQFYLHASSRTGAIPAPDLIALAKLILTRLPQ